VQLTLDLRHEHFIVAIPQATIVQDVANDHPGFADLLSATFAEGVPSLARSGHQARASAVAKLDVIRYVHHIDYLEASRLLPHAAVRIEPR
jgi:hypothetical protein